MACDIILGFHRNYEGLCWGSTALFSYFGQRTRKLRWAGRMLLYYRTGLR